MLLWKIILIMWQNRLSERVLEKTIGLIMITLISSFDVETKQLIEANSRIETIQVCILWTTTHWPVGGIRLWHLLTGSMPINQLNRKEIYPTRTLPCLSILPSEMRVELMRMLSWAIWYSINEISSGLKFLFVRRRLIFSAIGRVSGETTI